MSVHGNQYILPLFFGSSNVPAITDHDELTLAYYLITKDLSLDQKLVSFARLAWPYLCIQGIISTHIILDGIKVFSKKGKLSNPPRQPLVGHLLRNVENRTKLEQLDKILEVLTYKDTEAQEIGEGEESEYQQLEIKSLINPDYLQTLIKLIPYTEYKPIADYMPLDSNLTTDEAIDIAQQFRDTIDYMKGNSFRWETQTELISKEVEKWLIDLNVQLKDIETRYSSQISKTSQVIDSTQMRDQIALESDKIDQWKVEEKKKLTENVLVLFRTVERTLDDIIKKNKLFTRIDMLKGRVFEDLLEPFDNHFSSLKTQGYEFIELIDNLRAKYDDFKEKGIEIDQEAESRMMAFKSGLENKLKDRDRYVSEFESEKEEKINELNDLKFQIENKYTQIQNVIKTKQATCLQEARELSGWALSDNMAELFTRPIQWIYMPFYAAFIEDQASHEEKIKIIFPGYIDSSQSDLFKPLSGEMENLRNHLYEEVEDDMILRSNFEFSCENMNILQDKTFAKKIQQGISILRNKGIIDDSIERIIREKSNLTP
jgi:hypothetical protein